MASKRASPVKKPSIRKSAARLTDSTVEAVENSKQALTAATIDPETRRRLVAAEAYFLAERRGFAAGNELEDWVLAEANVDSRLQTPER